MSALMDRSIVLCLLVLMALATATPGAAADGATPTYVPLAPDTDTFHVHLAADLECGVRATIDHGVPQASPLFYATNVLDDPCATTAEDAAGARSVFTTRAQFDVRLIPVLDQAIELVAGEPIVATVWLWTEHVGALAPRFTLGTQNWSTSTDAGPQVTLADLQVAPGGVTWQRFDVAFGAAPATVGPGLLTLGVILHNDDDELRHVSLYRTGLGVAGAHKSSFTLPLDTQVDDPPEPVPTNWPPPIETATVRPGVQHVTAGAQCTTNFVFRDRTSDKLYIGTAAHCVTGVGQGGASTIRTYGGGTSITATVAFSTWWTSAVGSDFALLEIPKDREKDVHPAVIHFGGPTALANMPTISTLDKVITFGNSGLRPGPEALDWHEGYVTGKSQWYTDVYTITPGIFGDSGSGVMTRDGAAIGAASTIAYAPIPGENAFGNIPPVIAWLNANGWALELQTWPILDPGALPAPFG